jgi:hypothetical protein
VHPHPVLLSRFFRCFWTAYALDEYTEDAAALHRFGLMGGPPTLNVYCKHFTNPKRETKWAGYLGEIRLRTTE